MGQLLGSLSFRRRSRGLASGQPSFNGTGSFSAAAIAAYSFLGFGAVTTPTEETINRRRTVPRAIVLVALIDGIFVVVNYVT